jgi:NAD/NADP transhydrogenase beta subunit
VPRLLAGFAIFFAAAVAILGFCAIAYYTGHSTVFPEPSHQVELLSIFLGAATLAVTAVGVIVAIGAVVGYTALRDEIKTAADRAAREAVERASKEVFEPAVRRVEETLLNLTTVSPADRTQEIAAALADRGNDGGPAAN